jgi:N-acetylneuraminate synthase
MLRRLELSFEHHVQLLEHCNLIGIEFLSSAFDSESLRFIVNDLGLKRLKIPSGELTNAPLILEHARSDCDLIVSTGMASLGEIEDALSVIAFGYTTKLSVPPSKEAFYAAYCSEAGKAALRERVTLLHCTTEYPAPFNEINLRALATLNQAFQLPVGLSDHSAGIIVPIAAVALGAVIIEKHFTLDKTMEGPDHNASLEPDELAQMIDGIQEAHIALGGLAKIPSSSEILNRSVARKSLVANCDIKAGEQLSAINIAVKRPGLGMSPYDFWRLLNKEASQNYTAGDLLCE